MQTSFDVSPLANLDKTDRLAGSVPNSGVRIDPLSTKTIGLTVNGIDWNQITKCLLASLHERMTTGLNGGKQILGYFQGSR